MYSTKMIKLSFYIILLFMLIISSEAKSQGNYFGYVNAQNLILLHPLMQQYDVKTGRFKNTSSYPKPSEDIDSFLNRLRASKASLEEKIKKLEKDYSQKIVGKSLVAQKQWFVFWKRREYLKIQCDLISEAIEQASHEGDYFMNMPSLTTIFPVTKAVAQSITDVLENLKNRYNLGVVFDTSAFIRYHKGTFETITKKDNIHQQIWRGATFPKNEINDASLKMMSKIQESFPHLKDHPFLAGAKNLNKEAANLINSITSDSEKLNIE